MQTVLPLACFLSVIRPPGVQYENAVLQIAPVDKSKCPFVKNGNDVSFQLFTRHNPTAYQELMIDDDEKLFASNIDFNDPTMIYFHAFMEETDDGSGIMVREAYMQRGDTNVIMVDAHHLEAGPWYFTAAQNTWYIGRFAAQFVDYLVSRGLNLNTTHLVGHSLGSQSAGVAGAYTKSGRVARITGLDPALPLFNHLPLEQRLDPTDAEFVDVIHTDAGIFGFKEPIGHVDFYPNGGHSPQPGCELEVVIPKQLLLNKCDGTENPRGFHTYHMETPYTNPNNDHRAHEPTTTDTTIEIITNLKYGVYQKVPQTNGHAKRRPKRFLQFFKSNDGFDDNFVIRALNFLIKNRKNVLPVLSVMREINTLVRSANGELNHVSKESNNYIGGLPPPLAPVSYSLELGNGSKLNAFVQRLFGLAPSGDRLTVGGGGK